MKEEKGKMVRREQALELRRLIDRYFRGVQKDAADAIGYSDSTVSRALQGRGTAKVLRLLRMYLRDKGIEPPKGEIPLESASQVRILREPPPPPPGEGGPIEHVHYYCIGGKPVVELRITSRTVAGTSQSELGGWRGAD